MIKSACCWQWPVNPHNSTSIRQKKERRPSAANLRPLNGSLCAGRCRAQTYSPHASAAQSGAEKARCTHPCRKRRRGNARYNSPAHSGRRAGRKKRADMARNGKLVGREESKRPAWLDTSSSKKVRTGQIRCRSGRILPVLLQSGEGGCIWPYGRNGSKSRF